MPPTTGPLSRNFLDETFVRILTDEQERQALWTNTSPGTCYGRNSNIPLHARGICRAQTSSADPIPFVIIGLASSIFIWQSTPRWVLLTG
jgi:hypothetical protein